VKVIGKKNLCYEEAQTGIWKEGDNSWNCQGEGNRERGNGDPGNGQLSLSEHQSQQGEGKERESSGKRSFKGSVPALVMRQLWKGEKRRWHSKMP